MSQTFLTQFHNKWDSSLLSLIIFYPVCAFLFWTYLNLISSTESITFQHENKYWRQTENPYLDTCMLDGLLTENSPTSAFFTTSSYLKDQILTSPINFLISWGQQQYPCSRFRWDPITHHDINHVPIRHSQAFRAATAYRNVHQLHMTFRKVKVTVCHHIKGQKSCFPSKTDRKSAKETFACNTRQTCTWSISWFLPRQSLPKELRKGLVSSLGFGH